MQARDAAQIFHDWTLAEGMISESPLDAVTAPASFALITPITESGKTTLRNKRITTIGFNEQTRQIVVYTALSAPSGKKALSLLPSLVDDVEIRYAQAKHSTVGPDTPLPYGGPAYTVRPTGGQNRYTCGSSISVGNEVGAGTLGCLVRDSANVIYGLSNNHVSGSCSNAEVGLPIVAPGLADVVANGLNPFTIGLHVRSLQMVVGSPTIVSIAYNTDAALFSLVDANFVSSFQGDKYDTPALVLDMAAGLLVEKVGRTTGHTKGVVESQILGPIWVSYAAPSYGMSARVFFPEVFIIEGTKEAFSDHGDSGSLITTEVGGVRHAVGLVFAGGPSLKRPGERITYALPLAPILRDLGVTLVSGHNA